MRYFTLYLLVTLFITTTMGQSNSIVFTPHWLPQAQFAGYYVAQELGFYDAAGLDVEIVHPSPQNPPYKMLLTGESDIISTFLTTAISLNEQIPQLRHVAQLSKRSSIAIVTRKSSNINSVKDFEGRKVGIWSLGFEELPRHWMSQNAVVVDWVPIRWTTSLFLLGAIDALTVMWYNEYAQLIYSGVNEDELTTFFMSDQGYDIPEDGLYVLDNTLENKQEAVMKFIEASNKGWEYAKEHRVEAVEIVLEIMKDHHLAASAAQQSWMLDKVLQQIESELWEMYFLPLKEKDYDAATKIMLEENNIVRKREFFNFVSPLF
jgi:NitT/TauT family transport system substrate-binding protein